MSRFDLWDHVRAHLRTSSSKAPSPQPRGRVLRVKEGYNPNSSSIGTAIPTYLAFAAGSGALAVLLLNLRSVVAGLLRKQAGRVEGAPEPAADEREDHGGECDGQD